MKCKMMYCNEGYNYGEATFKDGKWEGVTICPKCNGTGEVASEPVEVCEWEYVINGEYNTACNELCCFKDQSFKYCPYCGKQIKIKDE